MTAVSPEAIRETRAGLIARQLENEEADRQREHREGIWAGLTPRFGAIAYADLATRREGRLYLAMVACEIPGCDSATRSLLFDHCHAHGWIRGAVCASHNVRLGHIDAVRALPGVVIDFTGTPYGKHLFHCLECAGQPRPTAEAARSSLMAFMSDPAVCRAKGSGGITVEYVYRPPCRTLHLVLNADRTWCGLPADGMQGTDYLRGYSACARCGDRARLYADRGQKPDLRLPAKLRIGQLAFF